MPIAQVPTHLPAGVKGLDSLIARGAILLRGRKRRAGSRAKRRRGRVPPLYPLTCAHEVDSATRWGRHMAAVADSIFAQFGSGPRRSLRRSAERPARAAWAALRLLAAVAIGATMELRRSWRTLLMMLLLRPRGAGELRGHRQQAALKDQRFRDRPWNWRRRPAGGVARSVRSRVARLTNVAGSARPSCARVNG